MHAGARNSPNENTDFGLSC